MFETRQQIRARLREQLRVEEREKARQEVRFEEREKARQEAVQGMKASLARRGMEIPPEVEAEVLNGSREHG